MDRQQQIRLNGLTTQGGAPFGRLALGWLRRPVRSNGVFDGLILLSVRNLGIDQQGEELQ